MKQGWLIVFVLLGMIAFPIVNCDLFTTPDLTAPPQQGSTVGGEVPHPEQATFADDVVLLEKRTVNGKCWYRFQNLTGKDVHFHLPSYERVGNRSKQHRFDYDHKIISGFTESASLQVDRSGCWQCDLLVGEGTPPEVYVWPEEWSKYNLRNITWDLGGRCPEPCTLICEDPLELDEEECECKCSMTADDCGPGEVFDSVNCKCNRGPCDDPVGEPECQEQVWNPDTCKWEGDCPCEEEDCGPGFTWNPQTCECECTRQCEPGFHLHPETCDCWCDPVGEPECPEQTWNEDLCEWEGDCQCPPEECPDGYSWEGEPVCDCVCTRKCRDPWVLDDKLCECKCGLTTCEYGYELDKDNCKCIARDICHVSNGGQPGECDWNLQEQPKKFNPGHAKHMEWENQCPPDYFGSCDGRYLTTPHPCMLACQPQ